MRLSEKLVHPGIFKAVDKYTSAAMMGTDPVNVKAAQDHSALWFATYGKQFYAWLFTHVAIFFGGVFLVKFLPKPLGVFCFLLIMLALLASAMYSYARHKRILSAEELRAMLPNLELTDAQRGYSEAVLAVHDARHSEAEVHEVMGSLNSLLDEEANLQRHRATLTQAGSDSGSLQKELAALQARTESTKDPGARALLQESIQILESRMANAVEPEAIVDQIDAQLELIRQTILSVRDTYRRLGHSASTSLEPTQLDHLRQSVAQNQQQARAIEAAVREVQSLG